MKALTVLSNMTAAISTSGRFAFAAVTRGKNPALHLDGLIQQAFQIKMMRSSEEDTQRALLLCVQPVFPPLVPLYYLLRILNLHLDEGQLPVNETSQLFFFFRKPQDTSGTGRRSHPACFSSEVHLVLKISCRPDEVNTM